GAACQHGARQSPDRAAARQDSGGRIRARRTASGTRRGAEAAHEPCRTRGKQRAPTPSRKETLERSSVCPEGSSLELEIEKRRGEWVEPRDKGTSHESNGDELGLKR